MREIILESSESRQIEALLDQVVDRYATVENGEFLRNIPEYTQRLPSSLRTAAGAFRHHEDTGALLIRGIRVDDEEVGATPSHWKETLGAARAVREEFGLMLCASLLGDVFSWASQQAGRMVSEVIPIEGDQDLQINSGSTSTLLWHTEDAFHPHRADYVGLMCVRNPSRTVTTLACIDDVPVDAEVASILFEKRFRFAPDPAHVLQKDISIPDADPLLVARQRERMAGFIEDPALVSILFGDRGSPYIRLDSDAIIRDTDDPLAMEALEKFMSDVDGQLRGVCLEPGDLLFVDNYRAVHGRAPFQANFDRRDRWLKRVNVTRDLRRTRAARETATSRIVY